MQKRNHDVDDSKFFVPRVVVVKVASGKNKAVALLFESPSTTKKAVEANSFDLPQLAERMALCWKYHSPRH
jgi:hypothetical protein